VKYQRDNLLHKRAHILKKRHRHNWHCCTIGTALASTSARTS
jgi:hypothetical protein